MSSGSSVWHPYTPGTGGKELWVESASGAWLHTRDGRKILDAIASWWVCLHGHARPEIATAVAAQAGLLEQVIFAGFTHQPAEELASTLTHAAPGNMKKAFFSDNGSTAVEVAVKMALQFFHLSGKPRKRILALRNAYHGDTFGAMSVGERGPFSAAFRDHLFEVTFLDVPYFNPLSGEPFTASGHLDEARKALEAGDVAAVLAEPGIQGAAGMRIYPLAWLDSLFALARSHGALCLADEVFTGFFRTGTAFATAALRHPPDILCLSKGLTGGFMPLGLTLANEKVAGAFAREDYAFTLYHGHSFTGNPLACSAALASWKLCTEPDFLTRLAESCARQKAFIRAVYEEFRGFDPRFFGNVSAFTLNPEDGYEYTHPLRQIIYRHFMDRGLLVRPVGNVLYLAPPFCLSPQDWDLLFSEVTKFLRSLPAPKNIRHS